jgi:hypothetical protein
MTLLAVLLGVAFVAMWLRSEFYLCRANNLQLRVEQLECELDDARREVAHVRHLHSTLLDENTTLLVDLMHTERQLVYYRSARRLREPVRFIVVGALTKKEWRAL